MKNTFHLNAFDIINIWINETPIEKLNSKKKINLSIPVRNSSNTPEISQLVIEIMQPRGARCLYGLLGIEIEKKTEPSLNIITDNGAEDYRLFNDSLLSSFEIPKYGFPDEISEKITQTMLQEILNINAEFGGEIRICFGVYSDISSNLLVFKKLAKTIANNILLPEKINTDSLKFFLQ